jgi:hypothetical protein
MLNAIEPAISEELVADFVSTSEALVEAGETAA